MPEMKKIQIYVLRYVNGEIKIDFSLVVKHNITTCEEETAHV